ncbi:hypothetical protein [Chakrabartyella piscis]|uniref:hypothetical protein n=1 Tax=Chakrabartyella piscis TaxID=2918914 RepID=UPI0029588FC9|nr:hypothetical protein [Chakrabartyella piscis]
MKTHTLVSISLFGVLYLFSLLYPQLPNMDGLRLVLVCLCFVVAMEFGNPKSAFLTLCADYFILFTPYYAIGILLFGFVHILYLEHLLQKQFSYLYWILPFCTLLPLTVFGLLYGILFSIHIFYATKKAPTFGYLLALILFAFGDILVGVGYFTITKPAWIWLFYAPSQMLLALTAKGLPLLQWFYPLHPTKD